MRVAKRLLRTSIGITVSLSLSLIGCASDNSTPTQPATPSGSASAQSPSAATTTSATAPPHATSGILALFAESPKSTYGYIDPSSGQYSEAASFKTVDVQVTSYEALAASPDLTKLAVSKDVDGHRSVGWIDTDGQFTNVTPYVDPGPFGGRAPTYTPIGFDGAGNFFYQQNAQGLPHPLIFELPAGSTTNPQDVSSQVPFWGSDGLEAFRNFDGTMRFGCRGGFSWLGPNAKVMVMAPGTQIDRSDVIPDPRSGCPDMSSSGGVPLLPATNDERVTNAVGSPDGTQVVFQMGTSLYIVGADGSSQPTKLEVPIEGRQFVWLTLLGWSDEPAAPPASVVPSSQASPTPTEVSGIEPFTGYWFGSRERLVINADGSGSFHHRDYCPTCSMADTPYSDTAVTMTSVSGETATGSASTGGTITLTLVPDDNTLQVSLNGLGTLMCREDNADWCGN